MKNKDPRNKLGGFWGGPDYFVVRVVEGDRKRSADLFLPQSSLPARYARPGNK